MAITTYAELQSAIADRLNRTDNTTVIQEAIAVVESRLNRTLRHPRMVTTDAAFAISSRYTDLPATFAEMIRLTRIDGDIRTMMRPCGWLPEYNVSGAPLLYSILGTQIQVAPAPSAATTCELVHFRTIPALSASNTTNWMLTYHPDVYLYGGSLEAAIRMEDAERQAKYAPRAAAAVEEVKEEARRWRKGSLAAPDLPVRSRFNILTG